MTISNWLGLNNLPSAPGKNSRSRVGHTVAFDVSQDGNRVKITGDDVDLYFVVEGIDLPPKVDATFAVWAVRAVPGNRSRRIREGSHHPVAAPINLGPFVNSNDLWRLRASIPE